MPSKVVEWPFYSYGLSDNRWDEYNSGNGIAPEVWLINWNDGGLGLLVALAAVYHHYNAGSTRSLVLLVLLVLFRDATLWRETVEYMWDHHRHGRF